jgi:hypothetical protein
MVTAISNQLGRYRRDHREGQRTLLGHIFLLAWFFVIFVSVYDGYLVLENRVFLDELNPIGRMLISLNGGGVWLLLAAKFVGTVIVASMLRVIYDNGAFFGTAITAFIAVLQLCLLLFLLFV